ncbi:hypothetical protein GKP91_04505 [Salmonella enterica subsp. enterica serovar Java]|nr:hypothetical protein [Salmonella enterica]ECE8725995.1 hypothetical protein [Salmonella enterica subsp. enterica serovar Java]EDR9849135.1 hypothetical protein [Salmonella enterica subsp. enterica]EDZ3529546.1 hypothetical protein [Salmonella enterica subsp. arizonae]EAR4481828.1 hypothetical protein [Salmonella enterica]
MNPGVVDENGDPLKGGGGISKGGTPIKLEGGFYSVDGMKISQWTDPTTEAANEVVESLRNTGQLPKNDVDKTQAMSNAQLE